MFSEPSSDGSGDAIERSSHVFPALASYLKGVQHHQSASSHWTYMMAITIYTMYECTILNSRRLKTDSLWFICESRRPHLASNLKGVVSLNQSSISNFNEQYQCHQASQMRNSERLPLSKSSLRSLFPPLKAYCTSIYPYLSASMFGSLFTTAALSNEVIISFRIWTASSLRNSRSQLSFCHFLINTANKYYSMFAPANTMGRGILRFEGFNQMYIIYITNVYHT